MYDILFKPVTCLSSRYLRQVRLGGAVPVGTGALYKCLCGGFGRPSCPDKVRYGFIPEEWFTMFYKKTGATGPYAFGLGLLTYLLSKEIYVCNHEFYKGISMAILSIAAVKKLGPPLARYLDNEVDKIENYWKQARLTELNELQALIDGELNEQWRANGNILLMEVKKLNIHLQIEAAYRKALMECYKEVKRRLDYQVALESVQRRLNRKNMILWMIKEMSQELPNADEEKLEKLKGDVSAMSLQIQI
uniref:ATP synthase subunit b n=1 Tax=Glossina palpalis gambiensis TaxID=67801 RepID=A0A1B0BTV3_9MUSC